jgi:hypothetical protein
LFANKLAGIGRNALEGCVQQRRWLVIEPGAFLDGGWRHKSRQ